MGGGVSKQDATPATGHDDNGGPPACAGAAIAEKTAISKLCRDGSCASVLLDEKSPTGVFSKHMRPAIVILGAGGVGKSTIIKQLSMSMGTGINTDQRAKATTALRLGIINKTLHAAERALEGVVGVPELSGVVLDHVDVIQQCDVKKLAGSELEQVGKSLKTIWSDENLKAIDRKAEAPGMLSMSDELVHKCAEQFLPDVEKIFSDAYVPDDSDMLAIRTPTTNITYTDVRYKDEVFVLKDVGGQIQHQDTWLSAFKNTKAVLYVVSLDDYHRNSNDGRNRLVESLELFRMVVGSPALAGLPFVLIFNKKDLFREKLKTCPLSTCSAFVQGGKADTQEDDESDCAYTERCMQYISKLFEFHFQKTAHDKGQACGSYSTCATDGKLINQVMSNVFATMYATFENKITSYAF